MTAGSEESQTAAPYGRALDADKKSRLFAAVVKTTEMAKGAGLLSGPKTARASRPCGSMPCLARSRVDVTTADGGRLMDGVTGTELAHRSRRRPASARGGIPKLAKSGRQDARLC